MGKKPQIEEMKCPQWMMTFGDFISLLVTFFVMLIAFSSFEDAKLAAMIGSLKGAFGVVPQPGIERVVRDNVHHFERIKGLVAEPKWLSIDELSVVIPDLQMALKRFGAPTLSPRRFVTVTMLDEGVAIIISVKPLFAPGTAELLPGNEGMLREIGLLIEALANEVRVVGVVNDSGKVLSATSSTTWGLAIERAMAIKNGLMRSRDLSSERFAIGAKVEVSVEDDPDSSSAGARTSLLKTDSFLRRSVEDSLFAGERMEVIIVGRRAFSEMSPEEVIVRDKWK